MGLLDDLKNESNFVHSRRAWCSVCTLISKLSKEETEVLKEKMSNTSITHSALSKVLKANGYNITEGTLGRHRRGDCQGVAKG
jgi:hypothetical protein